MTIDYYNTSAQSYFETTVNLNLEELYQPFIKYLKKGAIILDAGCGSGRDTLKFLNMGFKVDAFDASSEMTRLASSYTGINIQCMTFSELESVNTYDAIWCCASLLHVPYNELHETMLILEKALKPNGICYVSFKYGNNERIKDGRHFTDLNESSLQALISRIDSLKQIETWITDDVRPEQSNQWLNSIIQKFAGDTL